MYKIDELIQASKLNELLNKKEKEEKKKSAWVWVLVVVGAVAVIAGIAYAVYRFLTPDYLEDFDEEEDNLDEDFFEDEDEGGKQAEEKEEKAEKTEE